MAGLSRTEKYKELRNRLQNDTGNDLNTKALDPYESRLNQIDANNFAAPAAKLEDEHSAIHAREKQEQAPVREPLHRTQHERVEPSFRDTFSDNENSSSTFDNSYLDQYIREVKQYNMEQGNAFSDNTQVNILKQMEQNRNAEPAPSNPYAKYGNSPLNMPKPPKELDKKQDPTAEIPFVNSSNVPTMDVPVQRPVTSIQQPRAKASDPNARVQIVHQNAPVTNSRKTFTEDLFENDDEADRDNTSQNMTKEDIMAEVQNLVNGTKSNDFGNYSQPANAARNNDYDDDRTARQQLLNETTQMRAQLDDYEDNLNEVSDRMQHTNKILNIVLVVLIIALAVILGIVIYWITLTKG